MNARITLSALLLAACSADEPSKLAINYCEYEDSFISCVAADNEEAQCKKQAEKEAIRIAAGIPEDCKKPGP